MSISPWMQDIKVWLASFHSLTISHICQEGNQDADWTATNALVENFSFNSNLLHLYPTLLHILRADAHTVAFP